MASAKYDVTDALIEFESGLLNEEDTLALFQHLIDSGLAWQLQDNYGITAVSLIKSGFCTRANY